MNSPSVNAESQLFLRDKQAWEDAIAGYDGADPLELWYNYICWFDYNIHIDPENKFKETLEKCLAIFEHNECYKQDIRMIKLWVKYIDLQPNPLKLYQILYQRSIGTQCACFYISWAHYYDSANAFREAESVYNLGFQAHAEPYAELQEAHTKFRLSVSQRMLYNDSSSKKRSANDLNEQRQQITTLNPPAKKSCLDQNELEHSQTKQANYQQISNYSHAAQVSEHSSRGTNHIQSHLVSKYQTKNQPHMSNHAQTPSYVQVNNFQPSNTSHFSNQGQVGKYLKSSSPARSSHNFNCMTDSNQIHVSNKVQNVNNRQTLNHIQTSNYISPSVPPSSNNVQVNNHTQIPNKCQSVSGSINSYNSSNLEQCSLKNSAYVISSSLNYIYGNASGSAQDESHNKREYALQNVKLPPHFAQFCRNNYETWKPSLFLEEPYDSNRRCIYQKKLVYPGDGNEYSPEEIRARKFLKRLEGLKYEKEKSKIKPGNSRQKTGNDIYISSSDSKAEEQIEASTIRFSTDANGLTKNKTITIKFRREKSYINDNYNNIRGKDQAYTYTIEKVGNSYDCEDFGTKEGTSPDESHVEYSEKGVQRPSPKIKKIRKIKLVNNYDDPKYVNTNKSNSTSYYFNQICSIKNAITIPHNEYENANLLLSFANVNSDSNMYSSNSNTIQTVDSTDDSVSNTDLSSSFNENSYLGGSNYSTPVKKLSQSCSKTSTPQYPRSLKRHTSNISLQNDDSVSSFEQSSYFGAEQDEEHKLRRLENATNTINTHLAKSVIDPFSLELCKAFLTKLNFPSSEENDVYRLLNNPIPKLANTKIATLADVTYSIEKEVGRGSYGSVFKAVNTKTGAIVALKFQKPANIWELYICTQVRKRIMNHDILTGFMDISSAIIAPNASILITEFSVYGSLLDINNKIRQATKKVMHESLVMHFSSQILNIVSYLHSCSIIHADIKPDNFLLMRIPSSDSHVPSLRLIDFGCAIDMTLFPKNTEFKKVIQTDGFTCVEMKEGKPWSYQTDIFCIAGTIHVMLFGEYMQLVKKYDIWDIKQKLPRYLKKAVWSDIFTKMLNIKDLKSLPSLTDMKNVLDNEVSKMDSELQAQIRALSNLLHRR